jgi:hypothetical protein
VTKIVSAPKMAKKMSFFCERERTTGATTVAMNFPQAKRGEEGSSRASIPNAALLRPRTGSYFNAIVVREP